MENEDILQKTRIQWEKLNMETNERIFALQRTHTLFNEIELLRKRIETIVDRVQMILNETNTNLSSFQQAKTHFNQLKVRLCVFRRFLFVFSNFSKLNSIKIKPSNMTWLFVRNDEKNSLVFSKHFTI